MKESLLRPHTLRPRLHIRLPRRYRRYRRIERAPDHLTSDVVEDQVEK